jgi:fructose-1,6-bisphosphatase/sedoheptulose 1,7-bisphosphatase-like protein
MNTVKTTTIQVSATTRDNLKKVAKEKGLSITKLVELVSKKLQQRECNDFRI